MDRAAVVARRTDLFVGDTKMVGPAVRGIALRLHYGDINDRLVSFGGIYLADPVSRKRLVML